MDVWAYTQQVGEIVGKSVVRAEIEQNLVRAADPDVAVQMQEAVEKARKEGDSLGSVVMVHADHVPAGIGEPCFDKLDAELAKAT